VRRIERVASGTGDGARGDGDGANARRDGRGDDGNPKRTIAERTNARGRAASSARSDARTDGEARVILNARDD
jgi:hypothetical protein